MNSKRASHEQVLWSLDNLALSFQKVAALECLEAKVIVVEVSRVVQPGVDLVAVCLEANADSRSSK